MADQGIVNYIRRQKEAGKTDADIRTSLSAGTMSVEAIDDAFTAARLPEVPESVPSEASTPSHKSQFIYTGVLATALITVAVFLFIQKQKHNEMQLELAVEYTCAFLNAVGENEELFSKDNPENISIKEFSDFSNSIFERLIPIQNKYNLSTEEITKELEKLKPRMKETDFKNEILKQIAPRTTNNSCT